MEKICVAVRVRPSPSTETINGFGWKVESNRISLHRSQGTPVSGISFAFDHVLDQECSNGMVYELMAKDIIAAAVEGFNGTVFAYGQTSSGKTFTMNGSEVDPGIIHRAVKDVFAKIEKISDREFLIRVSYMEIYNEEINDLFTVENQKLQIHESLECGVFVAGLKEEIGNTPDQVLNLINLGEANRHFGDTSMNAHSSRSHTIFRMVIESKAMDNNSSNSSCSDDAIRVATLNLVDLAGSERVAKTGAGGVRLKEGKHINKSLMILGNVINKLSEGGKQRGHIPYRDSKLTRILQPALGGNAKTSIICTVAPEEIHIEETKGTLQFASRAKRITNCVQVNEILTDGALLKRQQIEIEELRRKLQGSHAEVLEQEILKLRNDMLKYELERERLATELEQERKSHKERDLCLTEQQMKIDNLSNLALSDSDGSSSHGGVNECAESINSNSMHQQDGFNTPCFKKIPNVFVAKRSDYSMQPESSPLPDAFGDFADEDTWMKMNNGYKTDLDLLHMTTTRKTQSFPISEDCSTVDRNQEIQNLHKQLNIVTDERDELKRKYSEQMLFTNQINREIFYLQQEMLLLQKVPQNLNETVASTKNIYNNIISIFQNIVVNEKSATGRVFSITGEAKLTDTTSSLLSSDGSTLLDEHKEKSSNNVKGTLGGHISRWKQAMETELNITKQRCEALEKETKVNNQLLNVSEGKFLSLEREFQLLKEDREVALQRSSSSSEMLVQIIDQRDRALKKLDNEVRKRKKLEEEIKRFHIAFMQHRSSISSFQGDFKSILDSMKARDSCLQCFK